MLARILGFITLFISTASLAQYERIVSINLCTDQLLYLLEEPERISSVSFLSHDPDYSYLAEEMAQFQVNHANIEEIIPLDPDLVLAGSYTDIHTIHFLRSLGYKVEQVDIPWDMTQIEATIVQMGEILGKEERAAAIITTMQEHRAQVQAELAGREKPLAIILAPNGFTHGAGSMKGDLLELAHYENLAARVGIQGSGNISLEQIIEAQPDFLIIEDSASNRDSLAQQFLQHPALTKGLPNTQRITVNPNLWTCGGPSMIQALDILAEAHP